MQKITLLIVLLIIGLVGCTLEQPTTPAPTVNVEPPEVTVEPPVVNVQPPTVNVQPAEVTVQPPTVNVQPAEVTVQPPTVNVQPAAVTVHPPTVNVQPPTVNVELPPEAINPSQVRDTTPPVILSGTVVSGAVNVNPAPINLGGFRFDFNEMITGVVKLTDGSGVDLKWFSNVAGSTAILVAFGGQELVNEHTYIIEISVADLAGNITRETLVFVTSPKE